MLRTALKIPALGLRAKFFLYSNTVIAVTMGVATLLAAIHDRQVHYDALRHHARSLAEALAIPVTDALLYEDLGLVTETGLTDNYISEILRSDADSVRYVIVADGAGVVTHSNRWSLLGTRFERFVGPEAIERGSVEELRTTRDGERVLEVRTPLHISTRYWGSLALGLSLAPIEAELEAFTFRLAKVALLLMLANSVLTMFYVESLIRPILALHETMMRAGRGNLAARAWVKRGDEVGDLSDAFNRMMDEIEDSRLRDESRQTQLAHTEKMAAIGSLAAGVAHEVNNPLAGILACIENMRANPSDAKMRERYLGLIHDGLRRIERTVANLLDFSRQRELRAEPTSINHCLQHVAELADYQLRRRGVELRLDLDPADPLARADHFQMEQLFLNLVLNALQAMPKGGRLTLRTRQRDGLLAAEVHDTGMGIADDVRERIFDPFFTTREVGEGTGLGLSVSDSIVTAHGGRIEVESRPGEGSVFRVVLPAPGATDTAEEA